MEKESVPIKKQSYEKPVLMKHGNLKDVTSNGSPKNPTVVLGCTRF